MRQTVHDHVTHSYLLHMMLRDATAPAETVEEAATRLNVDIKTLETIRKTRYLNGRTHVPKAGNIHLAWEYAQNPADHHRFINMLRVSPKVFDVILHLIEDHPVFRNDSNNAQVRWYFSTFCAFTFDCT
jgi:hypothetical protein